MDDNAASSPLRVARLNAGFSQGDLAKKLGLSVATVSRVESGDRQTLFSNVEQWFAACGWTLVAAPVGGSDVGAIMADVFANVPPDALFSFLGVLKAWPQMSERERRVVVAFMNTCANDYGTMLAPVPESKPVRPRGRQRQSSNG